MTASSYSCNVVTSSLLFLLLIVVAPCSNCLDDYYFIQRQPRPRPWIILFDQDPEYYKQTYIQPLAHAPWIAIDERHVIETLANTQGFKIASSIFEQQQPLISFLLVDIICKERNGTKLFIPNCEGITVYLRPLENEKAIIEKDPEIIDDLRSGRRRVERVGKRVDSDEQEVGIIVHGADGFGSLEFPAEDDQGDENNLKRKIDMVIVAGVVPDQWKCDIDRDTPEWEVGNMIFRGELEGIIMECKLKQMPYGITMLFSLYF
ncbi:hypothetical protein QQ045_011483 [Rhodiola kirilowii]